MLLRYWQAALIAAFLTLFGNIVWAQESCPRCNGDSGRVSSSYRPYCTKGGCHAAKDCCQAGECCKDGKCAPSQKCDKKCTCCAESKCDCTKGGECCCKKDECKCGKSCKCCGKDTTIAAKTGCCPFLNKLAKKAAILMVMPSPRYVTHPPQYIPPSPPFPLPHAALPGMPPPPPMLAPPGMPMLPPQMVTLPAPPIAHPCMTAPGGAYCVSAPAHIVGPMPAKANGGMETCLQLMGLASDLCSFARAPSVPSLCESALSLAMDLCPPVCTQCTPCGVPTTPCAPSCVHFVPQPMNVVYRKNGNEGSCCSFGAAGQPAVCIECGIAAPAAPAKLHISAAPSSDELEMHVGGTAIRCKKMTVAIGDGEITLSRFEDRVRVRGDELKATAATIRCECGNRLILEGDVVLHYKKEGHAANFSGDRVELNLNSGAATIAPAAKTLSCPANYIHHFERYSK